MKSRRLAAVLLSAVLAAALTACGTQDTAGRTTVQKPGKTITVLEDKNNTAYNEVALVKLDRIEGLRGMDWITEDTIIASKENKSLDQINVEGGKMYPNNLVTYDLSSGKEQVLAAKDLHQSSAAVSPDKQYLFYKEGIEEVTTDYIINLETGEKVVAFETDQVGVTEGKWTADNHIIGATMKGKLYTVYTDGKTTGVIDTGSRYAYNTVKVGNKVYYISDGKMKSFDITTKKTETIADNVVWIIPSPDEKQFALVKRTGETKMTLYITDLNGKEKGAIAESTQIFGASWSPDGKLIAYAMLSEDGTSKGIFAADTSSLKATQLSADIQTPSDSLSWSPSGKKLMASAMIVKDEKYFPITYILTLKR